MGSPEDVSLIALAALMLGTRHIGTLGRGLNEAIEEFWDHFRGGPQPPTHPLPGNDSNLLNRRRSRHQSEL